MEKNSIKKIALLVGVVVLGVILAGYAQNWIASFKTKAASAA